MSRIYSVPLILIAGAWNAMGCAGAGGGGPAESLSVRRDALTCATPVSRQDRVDEGESMQTTVGYDPGSGEATITTTLTNSQSVWGWTGAVELVFVDQYGQPLFVGDPQTHGIDACWFSCPRNSTVSWSVTVPAGIKNLVAGAAIMQESVITNRGLLKVLKAVSDADPVCVAIGENLYGAICESVVLNAKVVTPELQDMTDDQLKEQLAAMANSIADKVSMFSECPLLPVMTGPSSPSGNVTRSGAYGASYEGWKAFDSDPNSMWISSVFVTPATIGFNWSGSARVVSGYALSFANGSLTSRAPKDWDFQGFDGTSWQTLDSQRNQVGWKGIDRREYHFSNSTPCYAYQFVFYDDNDSRAGVVVISLSNIEFFN